tara:strand:- start:620 stop:1069 length:450 start_codon:yes stop_codon:yes gene_type:complete
MKLQLTPNTHPILHERVKKCSYDLDRSKISKILYDNMMLHNGVGLSANQIGINERVFIMVKDLEYNEILTCFNPRIVKQSSKTCVMEEGCLSYPDEFLDVERSESVVVKYEDENKVDHKIKLEGFAARVFLHEFDHMEGINFTQRKYSK